MYIPLEKSEYTAHFFAADHELTHYDIALILHMDDYTTIIVTFLPKHKCESNSGLWEISAGQDKVV